MSQYEEQANKFLADTGVVFTAEYLRTGKHFAEDEQERDIYQITLMRDSKVWTFEFGQSINSSYKYVPVWEGIAGALWALKGFGRPAGWNDTAAIAKEFKRRKRKFPYSVKLKETFIENQKFGAPTAYDVLAGLQKYDVGDLADFLEEFGYTEAGQVRSGIKIYPKVRAEYMQVVDMWPSEDEQEQLQEIQ